MWAFIIGCCVVFAAAVIALRVFPSRAISLEKLRQRYCLPESRFVVLGGNPTHVVDEGNGPALILLHGNASSLWLWNQWAPILVSAGYRVIRMDMPPYGLSEYAPSNAYGVVNTHEILADLLDTKHIARAVLIGLANGGPPAAWYAATHPGRVAGLVLINAPFYPPQRHTATLTYQRLARKYIYPCFGRPWIADWLYVRELAGRHQSVQRSFVSHIHDLARRADLPDPLTVYGSSFEFQSDTWNPQGISNAQMLARLNTRALILWGGRSLLPPSEATRLVGHLPSAYGLTVKVFENAGHWLPLYRPHQTVDPVLEFLATIAGFESPSAAPLDDRRWQPAAARKPGVSRIRP